MNHDLNHDRAAALSLLNEGQMSVEGRLVDASNATFYCAVSLDGIEAACVYKPIRGERPLWDFPGGSLARREVATYALSVASGWDLVPPTVLRDGPFGAGMCQLWIEHDQDQRAVDIVPCDQVPDGWHRVLDAVDAEGDEVALVHSGEPALRRLALFDVLVNNADRKGGHVLYGESGGMFGVDHGLCLHVDDKLRTVLWGWAGEPIDEDSLDTLAKLEAELDGALGDRLAELVEADETSALRRRLAMLRRSARFPLPGDGWPAIPWPVF